MKDTIFDLAVGLIIPTVLITAVSALITADIQADKLRQSTAVLVWESK